MRLRLVHTLSLTLLAFASVAVLALGGLTAWHLRNGFGEYLASRDVLHFERFVGILESRLARDDGLSALREGRLGLDGLLDELNPRPGPGAMRLPGQHPPPPSGGSDGFPQRVQVVASDGTVLLGQTGIAPPNAVPMVERPVRACWPSPTCRRCPATWPRTMHWRWCGACTAATRPAPARPGWTCVWRCRTSCQR